MRSPRWQACPKYHFARCFEATYGETPIRYLTRRRIERAQDLLRAANLTVTEVCMLVGFSSLGSFSSRFASWWARARPRNRNRWAARGGAHVPGCDLFVRGGLDPAGTTGARSGRRPPPPYGDAMITNVPGHRVLPRPGRGTTHSELGPPAATRHGTTAGLDHHRAPTLGPDAADFVRRQLGKGQMGGLGLRVDDCRKTYDELSAAGVEFLQEPADRPYGVEAVMRDISSSWLVLVEPREYASDGPTA